jgi:hypothetical protein
MDAVVQLSATVGVESACDSLGVARASFYRHRPGYHILVGRQEYVESGFLSGFQQFPIDEPVPCGVLRRSDGVALEECNKRRGRTLIKQDSHQPTPSTETPAARQDCGPRIRARLQPVPASRRTTP